MVDPAVKIWVSIHWLAATTAASFVMIVSRPSCVSVRLPDSSIATLVNIVAGTAAAAAEACLRMHHALLNLKKWRTHRCNRR